MGKLSLITIQSRFRPLWGSFLPVFSLLYNRYRSTRFLNFTATKENSTQVGPCDTFFELYYIPELTPNTTINMTGIVDFTGSECSSQCQSRYIIWVKGLIVRWWVHTENLHSCMQLVWWWVLIFYFICANWYEHNLFSVYKISEPINVKSHNSLIHQRLDWILFEPKILSVKKNSEDEIG